MKKIIFKIQLIGGKYHQNKIAPFSPTSILRVGKEPNLPYSNIFQPYLKLKNIKHITIFSPFFFILFYFQIPNFPKFHSYQTSTNKTQKKILYLIILGKSS